MTTDRPIWPQGHERPAGEDPVPSTLDWDLWLGTAPAAAVPGQWPEGHAVYSPGEEARQIPLRSSRARLPSVHLARLVGFRQRRLGRHRPAQHERDLPGARSGRALGRRGCRNLGNAARNVPRLEPHPFRFRRPGDPSPRLHSSGTTARKPLPGVSGCAPAPTAATPLRHGGQGRMVWIGTKGSLPSRPRALRRHQPDPPPPAAAGLGPPGGSQRLGRGN